MTIEHGDTAANGELCRVNTQQARKAAHELRNVLAIISSNTEVLLSHLGDPEILAECERSIFAAIERAELIVQDSLESIP